MCSSIQDTELAPADVYQEIEHYAVSCDSDNCQKGKMMRKIIRGIEYVLVLSMFLVFGVLSSFAQVDDLIAEDPDPSVRTPITHGFWFHKVVVIGEEWYRGRLTEQGEHIETGELPDDTDPDGHLGFTAINNVRWNVTHHWFGGDDELAVEQLYSRNPVWFFDAANPPNSIMGVFAMFRWGMLNEVEARVAIHDMITSYTDTEYTILANGMWFGAMSRLLNGTRAVPNPLGLPEDAAIRNEMGVIISHHFFGRNNDNTVQVMDKIYENLLDTLNGFNDGALSEEQARREITDMVNEASPASPGEFDNTFFLQLESGLNMISLPLRPYTPRTARDLMNEVGATVVIECDATRSRFVGFTEADLGDGFPIKGGQGYIVNVRDGKIVPFMGAAWTNDSSAKAAPPVKSRTAVWAFVVSGVVLDSEVMSARDGDYTVIAKNLRTGAMTSEAVDSSGYFAAAWADLSRRAVIEAGDRIEVSVIDSSGSIVSGPFVHEITLDGIRDALVNVQLRLGNIMPEKSILLQNYPNPFNPETWMPYHLNEAHPVMIKIYSAAGQLIRTLDLGHKNAGVYASRSKSAYWDGRNEAGEEVASAVYFYSITAGAFSATRKMVVKK